MGSACARVHPMAGGPSREMFHLKEVNMSQPTGLTEDQARGFHKVFMSSFMGFTFVAIIAHVLVWMWRPWL